MPAKRATHKVRKRSAIVGIYGAIDIWCAILLLSGQVTATGVFVSPDGFWLSATGPILGGARLEGKTVESSAMIDVIDIVTALLLILGQVTMVGPWVSSGRFNLVFSGPAFGITAVPVPIEPSEGVTEFYPQLRDMVISRFVHPKS